uniref:Aldedh domain-containing protein n=1 Tax=Steinernema glaseri TaxID=37863 RepID=A0A1I8AV02_9BILA
FLSTCWTEAKSFLGKEPRRGAAGFGVFAYGDFMDNAKRWSNGRVVYLDSVPVFKTLQIFDYFMANVDSKKPIFVMKTIYGCQIL